jgi:hypothetical protein
LKGEIREGEVEEELWKKMEERKRKISGAWEELDRIET